MSVHHPKSSLLPSPLIPSYLLLPAPKPLQTHWWEEDDRTYPKRKKRVHAQLFLPPQGNGILKETKVSPG